MADRVASPSSPEAGRLPRLLGVYRQTVAGDHVVTPPSGTRWARMMLRGGGGAGGGNAGGGGGRGGGEGAMQRRLIRLRSSPFTITVGGGGAGLVDGPGNAGGASSALGYVAQGGSGGGTRFTGPYVDTGGVGVDGVDPLGGYGNFSGKGAQGTIGGGRVGDFPVATLGTGGAGVEAGNASQQGQAGGDGYIVMEFYG